MTTATTTNIITLEELRQYLPNPVRRSGKEYRTWLEPSRSKIHVSINIEKQVYYDFHPPGNGGSLVQLLEKLGVPVPRDMAKSNPRLNYFKQLALIARYKSEGRSYGCNQRTAVKTNLKTGFVEKAHRIMCLRWNCTRCASFLKPVYMEHFAEYHSGLCQRRSRCHSIIPSGPF